VKDVIDARVGVAQERGQGGEGVGVGDGERGRVAEEGDCCFDFALWLCGGRGEGLGWVEGDGRGEG